MPFPLAHPAAVLPLRRFCPHWLSLPALMVGSLSPDLSYLFSRWRADQLAHRPFEGFIFSVPAGLVFLGGLWLAARVGQKIVPSLCTDLALGRCGLVEAKPQRNRATSLLIVLVSIWVGAATHVLWDTFTHKTGWLATQVPLLKAPLMPLFGRNLRPYHVLWYVCSFGGAALLAYEWLKWRAQVFGLPRARFLRRAIGSLLLAGLIIPIAAAHHLLLEPKGNIVAGILTVVFGAGLLAFSRRRVSI